VKLKIDEHQLERDALDEAWRELAPVIRTAQERKEEVAENPERARDPEVEAYVRWLDTFNQELAAIQAVRDAAPALSADDLKVAHQTAQKLLDALRSVEAQRISPQQREDQASSEAGAAVAE
jgi:hypothetical protein